MSSSVFCSKARVQLSDALLKALLGRVNFGVDNACSFFHSTCLLFGGVNRFRNFVS